MTDSPFDKMIPEYTSTSKESRSTVFHHLAVRIRFGGITLEVDVNALLGSNTLAISWLICQQITVPINYNPVLTNKVSKTHGQIIPGDGELTIGGAMVDEQDTSRSRCSSVVVPIYKRVLAVRKVLAICVVVTERTINILGRHKNVK